MKNPVIEECGSGRQWTSRSACAKTLGVSSDTLARAIRNDLPIKNKFYFPVNRNESICWNCKNTAEDACDLFTKAIRKPPKGAEYKTISAIGSTGKTFTSYLVTDCKSFNPCVIKTIVK